MKKSLNLFLILVSAVCTISCSESNNDNEKESENTCTQNYCDGNTAVICANGTISSKENCQLGCTNGACNTETQKNCDENALKCDEAGIPQKCINNAWIAQTACLAGQHCSDGSCVNDEKPAVECEDGKLQCSSEGIPQKCMFNAWINQPSCTNGQVCSEGICVGGETPEVVCEENKVQCSETGIPQKCVSNAWVDQDACTGTDTCVEGLCKTESSGDDIFCKDVECSNEETCTGGICVSNEMLIAEENAECPKEWWDTSFCNADGNAVFCDELGEDIDKRYIYVDQCDSSCKIIVSQDKTATYSACVNEEASAKCKEEYDYIDYCVDENDFSYSSGYQCYKTLDDKLAAIDNMYFGDFVECLDTCNEAKTACEGACTKDDECPNDLPYCDVMYGECVECTLNEGQECKDPTKVCKLNEDYEYYCASTEDESCKAEACIAAEEVSYTGNICVEIENVKTCGCEKQTDCRTGYECDEKTHICTKTEVETGCNDDSQCSGSTPYCDNQKCVECIPENANKGCKDTSMQCMESETRGIYCGKPAECSADACKVATDPYLGNICIEGICGCQKDDDCNYGYECNDSQQVCKKIPGCNDDSECSGSTPYCYNRACVECVQNDTSRECKDKSKLCKKNPDTSLFYCAKPAGCDPASCKAETGSYYAGNICLDGACGCETDNDCNEGYECGSQNYCKKLPSCQKNAVKCEGNYVSTCNGTIWEKASTPCANGCDGGVCKEAPVCQKDAVKCEDNYISTCDGSKWVKASEACKNGCEAGKCIESSENPTAGSFVIADNVDKLAHNIYTLNEITLDNGVNIKISGNYSTQESVFSMKTTDYVVVTGLKSLSKITVTYFSKDKNNGFTLTAGSYSETITNIGKTEATKVFTVTDPNAKSFTIDGILLDKLRLVSISWE